MNRTDKKYFSKNDDTNFRLEIVYSYLVRTASFKKDDTYGIANLEDMKEAFTLFGKTNMSRYLKKLSDLGFIDVLKASKNQFDYGCVKIIHYQESQRLTNYGIWNGIGTASGDSCGDPCGTASVAAVSRPTSSNNKEKPQIENSSVTPPVTAAERLVEPLRSASGTALDGSIIEEQKNRKNRSNRINKVDASDPIPVEIDQLSTETNFDEPPPKSDSLALALSKPVKITHSKKDVPEGKSVETVNAYKAAYKAKYGCNPIINAATRKQACNLVDSVGKDAAPKLAQFYLTHHGQWYVRHMHKFGVLLSDAEKLHTEMLRGEYMTETMARKVDKDTHTGGQLEEIKREFDSGIHNSILTGGKK